MAQADGLERGPSSLDRIVFFSDAVFAIAMTLLVLPLADTRFDDEQLPAQLVELLPKVFSFVLSFAVLGLYWVGHHRTFRYIVSADRWFLFLNLLMLLFVAWLPFPTAVLGEHGDTTAAAVFYACSISALGLSAALLTWYATQHQRLIDDRLSDRQIRHLRLRSLIVPAVYLPSIPVAFVSPLAATLLWLLTFVLGFVLDRVIPPPA